jgi:hypothetical protein
MTTSGTPSGLTTDDLAGRGDDRPDSPYPDEPRDAAPTTGTAPETADAPLLDDATAEPFSRRWTEVQARFVDDPRAAVRDADGLVAELMKTLAERFADHKSGLEEEWNRGDEPDTEHLRQALQQYRSFFDRLLST